MMTNEESKKAEGNTSALATLPDLPFGIISSYLSHADLLHLMLVCQKTKQNVENFKALFDSCLLNPDAFFAYIQHVSPDSIFGFIRLLQKRMPSLLETNKPTLKNNSTDQDLMHYAMFTDDIKRIPIDRLKTWLSDNLKDDLDETINRLKENPLEINLLVVALARHYAEHKEKKERRKLLIKLQILLLKLTWLEEDYHSFLNLRGVDLQETDFFPDFTPDLMLQKANLQEANLQKAKLYYLCLNESDLRGANLREADLDYATLINADLRRAVLTEILYSSHADFCRADLRGANLSGSTFSEADFRGADFRGADLRGTDLGGADLSGTCLEDAIFDNNTKFSFADKNRNPHFISNADGLMESLDKLFKKAKDHPQFVEIKKLVKQEIIALIEKCETNEKKQTLYSIAYHHGLIASHRNLGLAKNGINSIVSFFDRTESAVIETNTQREFREKMKEMLEAGAPPASSFSSSLMATTSSSCL